MLMRRSILGHNDNQPSVNSIDRKGRKLSLRVAPEDVVRRLVFHGGRLNINVSMAAKHDAHHLYSPGLASTPRPYAVARFPKTV